MSHILQKHIVTLSLPEHVEILAYTLSRRIKYSEIDQIHLRSEAQYVSHHLPPVDCHTYDVTLISFNNVQCQLLVYYWLNFVGTH